MKVLSLLIGLWLASPQGATTTPTTAPPVSRVAVIGASMSAGFGIGASFPDGAVNLADVVNASIVGTHETPRSLATSLVYLNWPAYAERTMATLAKDPPTALVAIDYLFWSVHGVKSDAEREKQLASALAGLEKLSVPILVGDLPDVTSATVVPSPAITRAMLPSPSLRDAANARIRDWAKQHANVTVIPLADLLKSLSESEAGRLLQADRLHPTLDGLATIWIAAANAWLQSSNRPPAAAFDLRAENLQEAARKKISKPQQ